MIVLAIVVAFVNLGFWQLRRLDERRNNNAMIERRMASAVVPLSDLVDSTADVDDPKVEATFYRRVSATGRFDPAGEVLVRSRSFDGQAGLHVLTPLIVDDGEAVLINRGWVPQAQAPRDPPSGSVTVQGLILGTQRRGRIGPTDPPTGVLDQIARSDIERVQRQYGRDLYPIIIQAQKTTPAPKSELPVVLPAPALDEGSHLSYAVQWFCFTAVGIIGWVALIRRTASNWDQNEN